jgi:hypothetical protein
MQGTRIPLILKAEDESWHATDEAALGSLVKDLSCGFKFKYLAMSRGIHLLLALLLLAAGCKKEELVKSTPACIKKKINQLAQGPVTNPPAKIYSYQYRGKTVYYFPPKCCDIPSTLYDADCNIICAPDGGLTGAGDGRCADFFSSRTAERLIWEDKR